MKEIAQGLLIIGGGIGLLAAVPAAIYGWMVLRASNSDPTANDHLLLYGPLYCSAALALGLLWRKRSVQKNPRNRFKLTENGTDSGDRGGLDGPAD